MKNLTIVTSCGGTYGRFLWDWATSIAQLTQYPARVVIVTRGSQNEAAGLRAYELLRERGIETIHDHSAEAQDFGVARNRAVALTDTEWVMHLDCDDRIMPHALEDAATIAPNADVISFGYERAGDTHKRPANKMRLYRDGTGEEILTHAAPCSGVSPFRRTLWERSPYRTDMRGAWDTALWIGFARLGARFRATTRPCFWYWHHADSIFTKRRLTFDWTHALTGAQLNSLRRDDRGVAFIVPQDKLSPQRRRVWTFVDAYYRHHFPDWPIVTGVCPSADWSKGLAITEALKQAQTDVMIVLDSDCLVDPDALRWAVAQVQGGAPWAIPHQMVYRATQSMTDVYLQRRADEPLVLPAEDGLARDPYVGYAGGGIFVVRRMHYEAAGGIPRVFVGWGGEDEAIAVILDTLIGKHVRGGEWDCLHLWHEPQESRRATRQVTQNQLRFRSLRNAAARGPDALWEALMALPYAPLGGKPTPPWKIKAQMKGVSVGDRYKYLARRNRKPPTDGEAAG